MSSTTYINRANAQRSTGPKTVAGKQRSSQNALRHGLTGQTVVMPTEDLRAYEAHVKSFQDEYQPQGATEAQLVKSLADTSWRLNRVASFEATLLRRRGPRSVPFPPRRGPATPRRRRHLRQSIESALEPQPPQQSPLPRVRTHRRPAPQTPGNPPRPGTKGRHGNARKGRKTPHSRKRWLRFYRPQNRRSPSRTPGPGILRIRHHA
jgi:hypothetical protein